MLVWVKLYNLPLHFLHIKVLLGIGNALGKFLKVDSERLTKDIYIVARICIEVDLSQGLPDHILLFHDEKQWSQSLDYENTAFRCQICHQIGHLQSACPQNKKRREKKTTSKAKRMAVFSCFGRGYRRGRKCRNYHKYHIPRRRTPRSQTTRKYPNFQ